MADYRSQEHYYPDHMQYHVNWTEQNAPAFSPPQQTRSVVRKSAKWGSPEHKLFIATCEIVISEGHRRGKCFSATGWQRICALFNGKAGKNWTTSQLKNYWSKLRTEHKHFFELLRCSGIGYNSGTGTIIAPEHWWVDKIKENRKYAKYKDMNCNEIYETYGKLFGDTGDSTKYALSPSKLSQRGFDLDTESDSGNRVDKFPSNAEGTDSSDGPIEVGGNSSMNISGMHSGEKRKFKRGKEKGKKKKYGAREVSASLDQLVSVGTDLASTWRSHQQTDLSIDECVSELLSSAHMAEGTPIHMFALWFLRIKENRTSYRAAKTPYLRYKFIEYCFDRDNQTLNRKG